jgi:predicted transcriptional regulator
MSTAVLLVHHTGKQGMVERGSSVLRAACDSMLQLSDEDDVIRLESAKSKDARPFDARYLKLETVLIQGVTDADGEPVYSPVVVPATIHTNTELDQLTVRQRKVLDCISLEVFAGSGASVAEIAEATGIARTNLYNVISALMRNNLVEQSAPREPYAITAKGVELLNAVLDVSDVSVVSNVPVVFSEKNNTSRVQSVKSKTTDTTDTSSTNSQNQARHNKKFVSVVPPDDDTKSKKKDMFSGELPGMETRRKGVKD